MVHLRGNIAYPEEDMSNEIHGLLPHRDPFLFLDSIEHADEEHIVGVHTFGEGEVFFPGHFPDYPVVPGVILIETMAQCGGAGVRKLGTLGEKLFFLASVDKAKFRRQVQPGETVRIEITNLRVSPRMLKQEGRCLVGEEVAAEAQWMCVVGDKPA